MIIVTGTAGFIASCLVQRLLEERLYDIISVDDFSNHEKQRNFINKKVLQRIDRNVFLEWFALHAGEVDFVLHLGARTDTTERSWKTLLQLNLDYTKSIWSVCCEYQIPLIYASSAATYGDGTLGYSDRHDIVNDLQPLNLYGRSKNEFDKWALSQPHCPPFWAGVKFFNVYGPNEYHKGRMASVVLHAFHEIQATGKVNLFRSHKVDYQDGMQLRDFVYVKDVVSVIRFLMENLPSSGLYNIGTGQARPFKDLAISTFEAMKCPVNIEYVDMPEDIREKYQYFTEADISKLRNAGYDKPFSTLEEGIRDYVTHYLIPNAAY